MYIVRDLSQIMMTKVIPASLHIYPLERNKFAGLSYYDDTVMWFAIKKIRIINKEG